MTDNGGGGLAIESKPDNSKHALAAQPEAPASADGLRRIRPGLIDPSPFQPRQRFDEEQLRHLADSIARSGMMQPIVVRPSAGGRFELVAGERRLRAAKLAGLGELPAIVREIDDEGAAELALVENLQREDLNPVERARALRALGDRFNLTHAQIAERIGLERSSVTNLVRLLELESELLEMISHGLLSQGHGKALLGAAPGAPRVKLGARAAREEWSVRRLEQECRDGGGAKPSKPAPARGGPDRPASLADLERQLGEHLGTKVRIAANSKGDRGRLTVEFYSLDHFDGLMEKMGFVMRG
ncbi:MAG: ParB/RepB/Spo0J family partition protein [Phycisphaerales bacterium JB039]